MDLYYYYLFSTVLLMTLVMPDFDIVCFELMRILLLILLLFADGKQGCCGSSSDSEQANIACTDHAGAVVTPQCSNSRRTTGRHSNTHNDESLTNLVSLQVNTF